MLFGDTGACILSFCDSNLHSDRFKFKISIQTRNTLLHSVCVNIQIIYNNLAGYQNEQKNVGCVKSAVDPIFGFME